MNSNDGVMSSNLPHYCSPTVQSLCLTIDAHKVLSGRTPKGLGATANLSRRFRIGVWKTNIIGQSLVDPTDWLGQNRDDCTFKCREIN